MLTRMREKGQVTIPSEIREALHLSKNVMFSVAKVGDGILLIPKASVFESVANQFSEAAQKQGITLDDLLKDLRKIRNEKK